MGSTYLAGFLDENIKLSQLIEIQLQGNCYPPVPSSMNGMCERAVKKAVKAYAENPSNPARDIKVRMPNGVTFRGKRGTVNVWDVISEFRLSAIVESQLGDGWDE